jgi:hypothetical protein
MTLPPPGEIIIINLFLPKVDKSGNKIYVQLSTVSKVVRTMIYPTESASETGFAVRWLEASSKDDMSPLKDFVKLILGIARGFFQIMPDDSDESIMTYLFRFPESDQMVLDKAIYEKRLGKSVETQPYISGSPKIQQIVPRQEIEQADVTDKNPSYRELMSEEQPVPTIPEIPIPESGDEASTMHMPSPFHVSEIILSEQKEKPRKSSTGLYLILPLTYIIDGKELAGNAIKMSDSGLRIDTVLELPETYKRIQIKIMFMTRKKKHILNINGTVTVVKPHTDERGPGGIFEVELTLVNDPKTLGIYRQIIDQIKMSFEQEKI